MALKLCPSCRSEYVSTAQRCSDCGGALVLADAFVPPPEDERAPGDQLPPVIELALVRTGSPSQLSAFAERLQELGISSRVDAYPPGGAGEAAASLAAIAAARRGATVPALGLYVRDRDLAAAVDAVEAQLAAEMPDAFVPRARSETSECPACGTPIAADASACADCGLEFPSEDRT
jgi:hypothetical protein